MTVIEIPYEMTKPFLLTIHYARRMPCIQHAFGLLDDNKICGVVTFGTPASPSLCKGIAGKKNFKNVLELNRLVISPDYHIKNAASYLVGHALKMLPHYTFVVSYADWGAWHHVGYIYQATNFYYTGMTKRRTDKFSGGGHSRHYDSSEQRRQIRSEKHRYIYLGGNKKEKKQMLSELLLPIIKEYPKGTSEHYDTDKPKAFMDVTKPLDGVVEAEVEKKELELNFTEAIA